MNTDKLSFLDENQSVASVVTKLHEYFKNSYSRYKVKRSQLLSQLDAATGEQEQALLQAIEKIDQEMALFGVLNDALSIADRVVSSKSMSSAMGLDSEIYQIHHETEAEQQAEWKLAEYRIAQQRQAQQ
ncbi:MAG: hypothetical protein Fur0046_28470 [Cyanobacteria bacterium J069]|nr:MAG: hypothetical protein D6742_00430 [Cyanobacteria bacterium J069]